MKIADLREWFCLNGKEDEWWVNVDGKSLGKPLNLELLEGILRENPSSKILVLHVSQAELDQPPWIEVESDIPVINLGVKNSGTIKYDNPLPPPPELQSSTIYNQQSTTQRKAPLSNLGGKSNEPLSMSGLDYQPSNAGAVSTPQFRQRLKILFSFRGRINRKQFMLAYLLKLVLMFVIGGLVVAVDRTSLQDFMMIPLLLLTVAIAWLNISLLSRRLKDTGTTPWILLLVLVPFFNVLFGPLLVLCCVIFPSSRGPNKYGDAPYDIF